MNDLFEPKDFWFLEQFVLCRKPNSNDKPGWIYVYEQVSDVEKLNTGRITHILLHKIGRTGRKDPLKRVIESEKNNN